MNITDVGADRPHPNINYVDFQTVCNVLPINSVQYYIEIVLFDHIDTHELQSIWINTGKRVSRRFRLTRAVVVLLLKQNIYIQCTTICTLIQYLHKKYLTLASIRLGITASVA